MLVVFDIDENVLGVNAASMLAEREALWVFCKNFYVLHDWKIETTTDGFEITKPEPPVKLVDPPLKSKRTTPKKLT